MFRVVVAVCLCTSLFVDLAQAAVEYSGWWAQVPVPVSISLGARESQSGEFSVRVNVASDADRKKLTVFVYAYAINKIDYDFGRNFIFDVDGDRLLQGGKYVGRMAPDAIRFELTDNQGDVHQFRAAQSSLGLLVTESYKSSSQRVSWSYSSFLKREGLAIAPTATNE